MKDPRRTAYKVTLDLQNLYYAVDRRAPRLLPRIEEMIIKRATEAVEAKFPEEKPVAGYLENGRLSLLGAKGAYSFEMTAGNQHNVVDRVQLHLDKDVVSEAEGPSFFGHPGDYFRYAFLKAEAKLSDQYSCWGEFTEDITIPPHTKVGVTNKGEHFPIISPVEFARYYVADFMNDYGLQATLENNMLLIELISEMLYSGIPDFTIIKGDEHFSYAYQSKPLHPNFKFKTEKEA